MRSNGQRLTFHLTIENAHTYNLGYFLPMATVANPKQGKNTWKNVFSGGRKTQKNYERNILESNVSCEQKKLCSHALGGYCWTPYQVSGTIIQDGKELTPTHHLVWPRQS